jgi:hypothetical protein
VTPEKLPAKKFLLDIKYQNYATVNDFLSGPVFGHMMRPDVGIYDVSGEFRCQIHFPSLYKGSIGVPYFPTTNDCIINEIEVFTPVFKQSRSFLFRAIKRALSLCAGLVRKFLRLKRVRVMV